MRPTVPKDFGFCDSTRYSLGDLGYKIPFITEEKISGYFFIIEYPKWVSVRNET
jgi:hypothetical protein